MYTTRTFVGRQVGMINVPVPTTGAPGKMMMVLFSPLLSNLREKKSLGMESRGDEELLSWCKGGGTN